MPEFTEKPVIIGFISNLMFSLQFESILTDMGFKTLWIDSADQFIDLEDISPQEQIGEPLNGSGAELIEKLVQIQPGMILIDLDFSQIPWREWIALIKSAPATRRIPVVCICNHVNKPAYTYARSVGANQVVARSAIIERLPVIVKRYFRNVDHEKLKESCADSLSKKALKGIELFNRGEYFEAHEYLEEAWNEDTTPGRELYRAILQIAVAYLHIERLNYNGAIKMFLRVQQWIEPLPAICRGINVAQLKSDFRCVQEEIKALGHNGITEFDRTQLKPVVMVEAK